LEQEKQLLEAQKPKLKRKKVERGRKVLKKNRCKFEKYITFSVDLSQMDEEIERIFAHSEIRAISDPLKKAVFIK